jgi:hypothetical protein
MIKFLKNERVLILFVFLLFIFHWFSKDITNQYERPIAGDAQGYYSYLPALFIYQDLEYDFVETNAQQYYPAGGMKDFIYEVDGNKVNKTFPGVAVLYAPFFGLAHLTAHLFGFEADGFSNIYQLFFDFGLWFYFLFGLIFLRKLLEKLSFSSKIALFSTILIGFGTNMLFYVVYDQSVTHIFNFFMINGMLLSLYYWDSQNKIKWLVLAFSLLALIGITRPTNILVFGLVFFFFNQKHFFLDVFKAFWSKNGLKIAIPTLAILAIPFLLWKAQTGNWIVYSYGEEGFNFSEPHFWSFIFSYTKGWMTYNPVVIPILILGFYALFKNSWKKATIAIVFYLVSIYVFSSWWCWYYGAGMGQRVMVDHYVLLAFLLAIGLKYLWSQRIWRNVYVSVLMILSIVNVVQAYQIKSGIIQNGSTTKEGYWDSFMVLQKRARVFPQNHWEFIEGKELSSPAWEGEVNGAVTYSEIVSAPIVDLRKGSKLVFSFESRSNEIVEHSRAVLILKEKKAPNTTINLPYFLKEFSQKDEWTLMEFMFEPLEEFTDSLKIYFWNGDTDEEVQFRNINYQHYYSEEYL